MDNVIVANVIVLSGIALLAAIILYMVSKKFNVIENPKISEVENLLPGANCGACGKAGCKNFAESCVNAGEEEFKTLYCPIGGLEVMEKVASALDLVAEAKDPTVAVLKCNGTCENAPAKIHFDGVNICRLADRISIGQTGCPNGCLRFGDCAKVCKFDALHIDTITGLPVVDEDKCTSCGACVNICPRHLFEICPKGPEGQRVYVACSNTQKGALARKNCKAACIGCMKCTKICPEIKVENNLSSIPFSVSAEQYGEELVKACPTGAIHCTCPTNKSPKEVPDEQ